MSRLRLRLPATTANLGPGFDTLALALRLHLEIDAESASEFSIEARGRDAEVCAAIENNLLIDTYCQTLQSQKATVIPLRLQMRNDIPLGMGCGSSAAVRLAAIAMAAKYGQLGWDRQRILAEASRLEGHPDNAAACWLGGFVASAFNDMAGGGEVQAVSFRPPASWRAIIAMPHLPLSTTESRAVLPDHYSRSEVTANLQRVALLTAAFAAGRSDLLANAMRDWLHQPYRAKVCRLLPQLLSLAGREGIAGVALSGAGPAVVMLSSTLVEAVAAVNHLRDVLHETPGVEILICELETEPASVDDLSLSVRAPAEGSFRSTHS